MKKSTPYNALCLLCTGDTVSALLHRAARREGVDVPHCYPQPVTTEAALYEILGWAPESTEVIDLDGEGN